jgi:2-keto-4-pentenoate hydratase/2-oxohepta-3-ene-1,7-dioic acid hydratase in catechol pathway
VPRLIARFKDAQADLLEAAERSEPIPLDQVRLRAPVPHPSKIIAAAANYRLHHQEMGGPQSQGDADSAKRSGALQGEVFLKAPSSVIGPGDTVRLPNVRGEIHYEAELAVVVGHECRDLDEADAMRAVFGYTCLLDLTVRGQGDRSRRKSYDGFTPLGPLLANWEEITDPHRLSLRLWVNDDLRQDGNTGDMTVKIPALLSYASSVMTLYPGDLLATGTPSGVGPVRDGDRLTIEIEQIGRMSIQVQGPPPGARLAEPNR